MSRVLRIVSVALITAGLVMLADVAITLAWREPVSSIYGSIKQSQAHDELAKLESEFPSAADRRRVERIKDPHARIAALARRLVRIAHEGSAIGKIAIPKIDLDAVLIEGTDTASLEKGPGHYPDTLLPGQGGTIGIAGHRTTYLAPFRHIDSLDTGDEIDIEMPYATFRYTVSRHAVVAASDVNVVHRRDSETLVLTACHPLYSSSERWVVFARLRSERLR